MTMSEQPTPTQPYSVPKGVNFNASYGLILLMQIYNLSHIIIQEITSLTLSTSYKLIIIINPCTDALALISANGIQSQYSMCIENENREENAPEGLQVSHRMTGATQYDEIRKCNTVIISSQQIWDIYVQPYVDSTSCRKSRLLYISKHGI